MKKITVLLAILLLIFSVSVIAEKEIKVPFSAVKSSCYGQIDMSKAEFLLSDIGEDCVQESWLEANLTEPQTQNDQHEERVSEENQKISWEVYKVDDSSIRSAERFGYRVVIKDPVSANQIKSIGEEVIEKAKEETPFNALDLWFYDYPQYAEGGYVLAWARVAPQGEWANAVNVNTGDYSEMEVIWKDIKEKDWDKRLTPREAEIWGRWDEMYWENPGMSEDEILEQVAKEFDVTVEEVDSIATKQLNWVFQDLDK